MKSNVVAFPSPKVRNLYIVDDYHVILSHSEEEALRFVQERDTKKGITDVRIIDDKKILNVIKSGKVDVILWEREPQGLEQLRFKMTVREFIDNDLKKHAVPSSQDILEDRGAITPKR